MPTTTTGEWVEESTGGCASGDSCLFRVTIEIILRVLLMLMLVPATVLPIDMTMTDIAVITNVITTIWNGIGCIKAIRLTTE